MNVYFEKLVKSISSTFIYDIGRLLENDIITWNFLVQELKEQSRADLLFKIALNIEDAPIEKLADAVIEINDAKFIYDFA